MTSELKPNEIISEVFCAGPKIMRIEQLLPRQVSARQFVKLGGLLLIIWPQLVNFAKVNEMVLSMHADETNCTHAE
jgi:hypothetical protein